MACHGLVKLSLLLLHDLIGFFKGWILMLDNVTLLHFYGDWVCNFPNRRRDILSAERLQARLSLDVS